VNSLIKTPAHGAATQSPQKMSHQANIKAHFFPVNERQMNADRPAFSLLDTIFFRL
jgi:hypothetical protein